MLRLAIVFTQFVLFALSAENHLNIHFLNELFGVGTEQLHAMATMFNFVSVSPETITILLYTPEETTTHIKSYQDLNKTEHFNFKRKTKIIIHGWQSNGTMDFVHELSSVYHNKNNYNVIVVDWSLIAKQNYVYAAQAVNSVGSYVGDFIANVTIDFDPNFVDHVHLIGHSLGAHISGFAGKRVWKRVRKRVGRITGLDPAGPFFEVPLLQPQNSRLTQSDAKMVDLLHTNIKFFGVRGVYGHVDVYVNEGGPVQPHCINAERANFCSHMSALTYQAKSIENPDRFYSAQCSMSLLSDLELCKTNEKSLIGEYVANNYYSRVYLLELDLRNW